MNHSKGKWQAHRNSSWGTTHKENFGNNEGYVIEATTDRGYPTIIASVIGALGVSQEVVDANARLIADAPRLQRDMEILGAHLDNGRHYLMSVPAEDITVEDCLEAFGFGRNGHANLLQ